MAEEKLTSSNSAGSPPADRLKAFPIPTPIPNDSSSIHALPDDDAVDFGELPANANGSAVLSHSQISGPLSGTSVVTWAELMKAQAEEDAKVQFDSVDPIDLDAHSEEDHLAHASPGEQTSDQPNVPRNQWPRGVPSQDFIDLDEEAARLAKKNLTDQASLTTDRVSDNQSSVPSDQRWRGKTSAETLSDRGDDNDDAIDMSRALADSAESSAVDLGSEPVIDLPFPGSGSSVSSGSRSKTGRSSARRRRLDNSHVDLLAGPSDQASSRLADGSGLRSDAGSPSAQPVDVVNIRASNWLTGSLVGGLTGLAVCLGVWLSGALSGPKSPASSNNVEAPPPVDPLVVAVRTVLEQAQLDPSDPAGAVTQLLKAKSNAENAVEQAIGDRQALEASRRAVQDQLTEATNRADRLTEEKRAVDTALAEVRAEMQTQENERRRLTEELKAAKAKVAAGTTSAPPPPPAVGTDRAELAKLQDAVNAWQTKSTELERELAATQRANDALKQSLRDVGSFVVAVRHRLQTAPEARPSEILTALDTALAARASADVSRPLPVLAPSFRADRAFHRGLSAYRAGASADAERELTRAVGGHPYDARIWYFLGLAQLELGQSEKAEASFRQAVHLERQNQPASDEIDVLFERLPPETRRLLDDIRRRG